MKLTVILITFIFESCCIKAQNNSSDNKIEKMIRNFYTEYAIILNSTPISIPADLLNERIDSIAQKYCTKKIRIESKKWFENGQELFTNDYGIVLESLKKFTVSSIPFFNNIFIIKYTTTNSDASDRKVTQNVVLHISIIKEHDTYKINEIR